MDIKDVTKMRKTILLLLGVVLMLLLCGTACGETFIFDSLYASVDVPENFSIILRSDNLSEYDTWLTANGKDIQTVTNDFDARGVLLQAWTAEGDMCFEVTATQSDETLMIFDVNQQSEATRRGYRLSHYPDNDFAAAGYDFASSDWKNTDNGRFLILRYVRRSMGDILYRGTMRRTIRNGYEITLDLQVYGRSVTTKDNTALNKIWDTFRFMEIQPMPPIANAQINITKAPPTETNEADFSMEGTAAEGVKLTAVVMGMTYSGSLLFEATANKSGNFKMPITLPKEGVFLITVTGEYQGEDVVELAYPVTYQRMLLTVNVTGEVPSTISGSELTIAGTAEPSASIQVFVNSEAVEQKRVTSAGRFKIDFNLRDEGSYELGLVFSKKGLADRRLTYTVYRQWTDADTLKQLSQYAIKPSYSNLISGMESYEGRTMGYRAYPLSVSQSGDDWIVQMALSKNGKSYSNMIIVVCNEEPNVTIGERVMMYGNCAGMSLAVPAEDGELVAEEESYPCFELLLFAALE